MEIPNNKFTRYWWVRGKDGKALRYQTARMLFRVILLASLYYPIITYTISLELIYIHLLVGLLVCISYALDPYMEPIEDIVIKTNIEKNTPSKVINTNNYFKCNINDNCDVCSNEECSVKIRLNCISPLESRVYFN